jgi:outer membrane protein TolC
MRNSKNMNRFLKTVILVYHLAVLSCLSANAQQKELFSAENFIQQVKQYHPVARQANLVRERAAADLLSARGGFDPGFELNSSSKTLDGVSYYQYTNPELKIPTRIGVNLKAGYENSSGQYLNPEITNGVASYMGIEVPLLNGLLTDKKRTVLQQAKIYQQQSEQERLAMINDLLFNAYTTYWEWTGAYKLYQVYNSYLEVADKRNRLVVISFNNGDRAMADTIEAYAQLQNFRLLQAEALLELNKKTLDLSFFLWTANGEPYLLPPGYLPDTSQFSKWIPLPDTTQLIVDAEFNHPLLKTNQYKLRVLEAERKLKFQNLLPVVNLQANLLSSDYFQYKNFTSYYLENNYKLGVNVKVPLLFRQGRGEYKNIKLKIKDTDLELAKKTWEIKNKIRRYFTEIIQFQIQLQTANEMSKAYIVLLRTEELKFSQGESSLFLINTRENKTLEMQQKIIELQMKYMKAGYAIQWASGLIR